MTRINPIPVERARELYAIHKTWREVQGALADEYGTKWNHEAIQRACTRGASQHTSPWDDSATERLKQLQAEGYSAGSTAKLLTQELGRYINRNQVIGKLYRLGLNPRGRKCRGMITGGAVTKISRKRNGGSALNALKAAQRRIDAPPLSPAPQLPRLTPIETEAILGKGVAIVDLEPHHCRWIVTDLPRFGVHLYCGEKQLDGFPYCLCHSNLAYDGGLGAGARRRLAIIKDAVERLRRG